MKRIIMIFALISLVACSNIKEEDLVLVPVSLTSIQEGGQAKDGIYFVVDSESSELIKSYEALSKKFRHEVKQVYGSLNLLIVSDYSKEDLEQILELLSTDGGVPTLVAVKNKQPEFEAKGIDKIESLQRYLNELLNNHK